MKTLLIDGNSLLKNSFEATVSTKEYTLDINGIYWFLHRVRYLLDTEKYHQYKVVFDGSDSGRLRKNIFPGYKASRKDRREEDAAKHESFKKQKANLKSILSHLCPVIEDVIVEADDIIAYYVSNKPSDEKITIVTGDFDLTQLISPTVNIFYLNKRFKNKTRAVERYEKNEDRKNLFIDHKNFLKHFGHPHENIPIIKSICGDTSDEIPNIKGIKETSLFNLFPILKKEQVSIESILAECGNFSEEKNVKQSNQKRFIFEGVLKDTIFPDAVNRNMRLVKLPNNEFITESCMSEVISFMTSKNNLNDALELKTKLDNLGLSQVLINNFKTIQYFFKPFKQL